MAWRWFMARDVLHSQGQGKWPLVWAQWPREKAIPRSQPLLHSRIATHIRLTLAVSSLNRDLIGSTVCDLWCHHLAVAIRERSVLVTLPPFIIESIWPCTSRPSGQRNPRDTVTPMHLHINRPCPSFYPAPKLSVTLQCFIESESWEK